MTASAAMAMRPTVLGHRVPLGHRLASPSFFRTAAGAEMTLVLELPGHTAPWAIEVKRALAVSLTKGFHAARADIRPERTFVVRAGPDDCPLGDGVEARSLESALSAVRDA